MDVVGSPLVLKLEGIKVSWLHVAREDVLLCQLLSALERVHGSNLGMGCSSQPSVSLRANKKPSQPNTTPSGPSLIPHPMVPDSYHTPWSQPHTTPSGPSLIPHPVVPASYHTQWSQPHTTPHGPSLIPHPMVPASYHTPWSQPHTILL